jgi:hypothetical protein
LLFSTACERNSLPAPQSASHPPAADLTCVDEAPALTDEQVIADSISAQAGLGKPNERAQTAYDILAGRSCRDALHRTCVWHVTRGDRDVDCDKPEAPTP